MKLTIINPPANFREAISNIGLPALMRYGYSLFQNGAIYKRIIFANGVPQSESEEGYTFIAHIPPNRFSNSGNKFNWTNGDIGLIALATAYSIPTTLTWANILAIDLDTIPKEDFTFTMASDGNIIKDFAVNPII